MLRKTWTWLNANSGGLTALLLLATVIVAGYALAVSIDALREGNRIAWRTYLDTKSSNFGKQIIDKDPLHCVFRYNLPIVDQACSSMVYDKRYLPRILEYVTQQLSHLSEIKEYSDKEDPGYYQKWSADDARDLSNDPTGVVSFVLSEYFGCKESKCEFADKLGICITNDDYEQDLKKCYTNLLARRDKFLRALEPRTPSGSSPATAHPG
jgi:hypothetical protein